MRKLRKALEAVASIYQCTERGMADDIQAHLAGVKGAEVVCEGLGSFAVELSYRWWVWLTFGVYRRQAERVAKQLVRDRHTAAGTVFHGVVTRRAR